MKLDCSIVLFLQGRHTVCFPASAAVSTELLVAPERRDAPGAPPCCMSFI